MNFKRNQVEATIHALLSGPLPTARARVGQPVPRELKTRIRRLLEIDRAWGSENRDRLGEFGMAFFDELPSGRGHDVDYTPYRAFALAVALELLRFGFKQKEVVEKTALMQDELRQIFTEVSAHLETNGRMRRTTRDPRDPSSEVAPKRFLVVRQVEASDRLAARSGGAIEAGEILIDHDICRGWENLRRHLEKDVLRVTFSIFLLELSELVVRVVEILPLQEARRRGRPRERSPN